MSNEEGVIIELLHAIDESNNVSLSMEGESSEVELVCSERIEVDIGVGAKGDKPVKGVDYWTPEEVEAIKEEIKESIDEEYADEIEQISVPITLDMREVRIDYRCRKKPRAKVLIKTADGYQEAMAAVEYISVNTVRVSWSKAIEGELIIN